MNLKNIKLSISSLVVFYGISTLTSYLMPNILYTSILNIYMICKQKVCQ